MTEAEERLQALAEGLGLEGETLALIQYLSPDQCRKLGAREKENSYNHLVDLTTMAKILSLSKRTVSRMVIAGKIPCILAPNYPRFDPQDVLQALKYPKKPNQ